jgi:molecular chaperone HscB
MDAEFLMEQMEFRETISEVRDKDDPLAVLDKMLTESKGKIAQHMGAFSRHYAADELDEARDKVRKMQFLFKAQKEIAALIEQVENELM